MRKVNYNKVKQLVQVHTAIVLTEAQPGKVYELNHAEKKVDCLLAYLHWSQGLLKCLWEKNGISPLFLNICGFTPILFQLNKDIQFGNG